VVTPSKRIIFVGPGGVGKTTLARQVAKARVRIHTQNITTAVNAQADKKTFGH